MGRMPKWTPAIIACLTLSAWAQDASQTPPKAPNDSAPERWNLFYQATSIGQYHGTFNSPYSGPFSLRNYMERDASLTTTLFFGLRLSENTSLRRRPKKSVVVKGFSG